jgi:hypothetical protein
MLLSRWWTTSPQIASFKPIKTKPYIYATQYTLDIKAHYKVEKGIVID